MRALLVVTALLLSAPAVASYETELLEQTAQRSPIQLKITGARLLPKALEIDYQLSNQGAQTAFYMCPEPRCVRAPDDTPQLFVELQDSNVLTILAYLIPMDYNKYGIPEYRFDFRFRPLRAGEAHGSTITIPRPLESNVPYPSPHLNPNMQINADTIERVRLLLGVLPCPAVEFLNTTDPATGGHRIIKEDKEIGRVDGHEMVRCGSARGVIVDRQQLVRAEAVIERPGVAADAGVPPPDGGTLADGGVSGVDGGTELGGGRRRSCGCGATPAALAPLSLVLGLLLLRRTRRRA